MMMTIRGGSRICGKGGGAAATASAAGAKVFGGSRLKTLFGISKGGGRAPCAPPPCAPPPPESASDDGWLYHCLTPRQHLRSYRGGDHDDDDGWFTRWLVISLLNASATFIVRGDFF